MKRNATLDYVRGIAILIVILGHALLAAWDGVPSDNAAYQLVINCQMILLMFISGIACGYSFPSDRPLNFLLKKVVRLLIPYIVWAEIYAVLNAVACGEPIRFKSMIEALYASDFWFLRYLFVVYVVLFLVDAGFVGLLKLLKQEEKYKNGILRLLLFISILLVYGMSKIPYLEKSISIWFYIWFLAGYFVYTKREWGQKNIVIFEGIGTLAIDAMVVTIIVAIAGGKMHSHVQGSILVLGICYSCYFLHKHLDGVLTNGIIAIGKNTLPIYAVHWCLFFAPLYNNGTFHKIIRKIALPYTVYVVLFFAALLIATLIVIRLLRVFKVTRVVLLGEKK